MSAEQGSHGPHVLQTNAQGQLGEGVRVNMYTASVSKGARRRSLTLLIACLSAFAAFTAIATAQASAAPVQGSGSWYVNGAKLEGGSVPVKCQIPAGQTFKLTASDA